MSRDSVTRYILVYISLCIDTTLSLFSLKVFIIYTSASVLLDVFLASITINSLTCPIKRLVFLTSLPHLSFISSFGHAMHIHVSLIMALLMFVDFL